MNTKIMFIAAALIAVILAQNVHAKPDYGISCIDCHSSVQTNKIAITGQDTTIDLGTQLDGQVKGTVETFTVNPGQTVGVKVNVLDGSLSYALQLSGTEKGG